MPKSADQVLTFFPSDQSRREPQLLSERGRAARSDIRYWERAIFLRSRRRAGGRRTTAKDWRVQLQHEGRREEFNLRSANKSVAARLAREISQHLRVNGWEATLSKYKPDNGRRHPAGVVGTVGEFIAAVHATQPQTRSLHHYTRTFRQIVAESFLTAADPNDLLRKYDYRAGGRAEWIKRIDAIRLSEITPAVIQRWKIAYLARAGSSPAAQRAGRVSLNSVLRLAASLFAPQRLEFISLPPDWRSPFKGVKLEPRQSCRYRSSFDVRELIGNARQELADSDPQAYKVFLLALFTGLRRNEIDKLEWRAFDWTALKLHIEPTEHLSVKTEDSVGDVDLEQELASVFQAFRQVSKSSFVIETLPDPDSSRAVAVGRSWYRYRCQEVFQRLSQWLRAHGVNTIRPIHTLRKEYGSQICDRHGIYAASRSLRHADVAVTAAYYVDKRSRATTGLGALL